MFLKSDGLLARILWWLDERHFFVIIPALGILLSIGAFVWSGQRTLPEPEPVTKFSAAGDFCSIDIQRLSRWIMKVEGDEYQSFYLAVDTDDDYFIVSMNDTQFGQFEEIVDFTYSRNQTIRPDSVKIFGMVRTMGEENARLLSEALDVSPEEYKEMFGSTFLNLKEDPNTNIVITFIWVLGFSLMILALKGIVFFDEWKEKRRKNKEKL